MKYITLLFIFFTFISCTTEITKEEAQKIVLNKNLSLTRNDALKDFYFTEGIDAEIQEPFAETESQYYFTLQHSTEKFIFDSKFKILQITDRYILALLNDNDSTLAVTFKLDGTPLNFLLLENSFGNNEFSIQREYKILKEGTFALNDERYDVEWIDFPTKGISKLTSQVKTEISLNKEGFFTNKP